MNGSIVQPGLLHHPMLRLAAIAGAAGLLLSSAGAFDTEAASFTPRLVYWLTIAAFALACLEASHRLLTRMAPRIPEIPLRILGWAVLALPVNMVAVLSCKLLFGGAPSLSGFMLLLPGMSSVLAALQFVLVTSRPQLARETKALAPAVPSGALELPLPLRGATILALEAQDHYVRVHTAAGQALVRIRLADAIGALAKEGVQPHRSWWVARSAVASLAREGDRTIAILTNGLRVPVSRRARPALGPHFRHV